MPDNEANPNQSLSQTAPYESMHSSDPAKIISDLLRTERQNDGTRVLLRDLKMSVESDVISIPEGTVTDFSTIPWYGRILVRWSRVDIAGVVHDFLYHEQIYSRAKADRIWRLCAISGEHSANWIQGWIGWLALRVGGWVAWNACRRRIESGQYKCQRDCQKHASPTDTYSQH